MIILAGVGVWRLSLRCLLLDPGWLGQGNIGPEFKSQIAEVGAGWISSRWVSLSMKRTLPGKSLTISRNQLVCEAQSPSGSVRPQMSKLQSTKTWLDMGIQELSDFESFPAFHSHPRQTQLLPGPSAGWSTTSTPLICAFFYFHFWQAIHSFLNRLYIFSYSITFVGF